MAGASIAGSTNLKDSYRRVMDRVAAAAERSGRRPSDVLLVAVTKHAGPDRIRQLVELGHADLGESRVQNLAHRVALLGEFLARHRTLGRAGCNRIQVVPTEVRWHMVGHLQRNKVKLALPLVHLIHSVDSLRLAEELHAQAVRLDRVVDVLLQINATQEPSKFGVAAPAAIHLAEQIDTMINLRLRGLMTMAPLEYSGEQARSCFARTAEIFGDIRDAGIGGQHLNALSMGMTNDFEIAIEEGANVVRIGRAIFGEEAGS
ncbi:MAG: YggS family pyridoxal phosphate-dependent enzyme [Pirellulaceae bacterium]|jgi:hypothetical protein|nr:YggS family pyridoxal phosphate-dependent enzyme [Pirellulaceae bacterium]